VEEVKGRVSVYQSMTGLDPLPQQLEVIAAIVTIGVYSETMILAEGHRFIQPLDISHGDTIDKKAERSLSIGKLGY
jgi:hypothetical protein